MRKARMKPTMVLLGLLVIAAACIVPDSNKAELQKCQLRAGQHIATMMHAPWFNATDGCCEYAESLGQHVNSALTPESCGRLVADGMAALLLGGCIEPADGVWALDFQ